MKFSVEVDGWPMSQHGAPQETASFVMARICMGRLVGIQAQPFVWWFVNMVRLIFNAKLCI